MTEYELAELAINAQAGTTPAVSVFVTILSGYLIAAWLVGKKLSRAQITLINVLFIGFQLGIISSWSGRWQLAYRLAEAVDSIDPSFDMTPSMIPISAFGVLMLTSIGGCLKFMWDIRHPKTE